MILLLCLCLCLVSGGVWGHGAPDPIEEDYTLHAQWLTQFHVYLESSEGTHLRIATAIYSLQWGDDEAKERARHLIDEALHTNDLDAPSLWLLASSCPWREDKAGCEPGGVYEKLLEADPSNAAVILMRFSQVRTGGDKQLLDTEANRQLLMRAAEAEYFDGYWGRGADKLYEAALAFVKLKPITEMPVSKNPMDRYTAEPHVYAFSWAMGLIVTSPVFGYSNITSLCRLQSKSGRLEGVAACQKLARVLWDNGKSQLTKLIGFAIERVMLEEQDPEDPGVQSWKNRGELVRYVSMCQSSPWQTDDLLLMDKKASTLMDWMKNLSDLGEVKGNRLSAIREYTNSDDDFTMNPADCDMLYDIDDEAIEALLGGQNSVSAWRNFQKQAQGASKQNTRDD